METKQHEKLLYKELSYQIQGAAIEVRKNFGSGLKESIYQNAFAEELKSRSVSFEKEKSIQIFSPKTGKLVGSYRPDFIVDEKILIELKAVEKIPKLFLDQIYSYLKNSKYELGYFINFTSPKLYIKRIILTNDHKPFLKNLLVSFSLLFVLFGVFAPLAQAAEISFDAKTTQAQVGQNFEVTLFVNTEQENINAFEGKIIFSNDLLDLKEIRDGNTIVNLWIDKPHIPQIAANQNTNSNEITFSGIIPGGYVGNDGLIFSLIFEAKKEGEGVIEVQNAKTLLNDGLGTPTQTMTKKLEFVAIRDGIRGDSWSVPKDAERPELFVPEIARDESVSGDKWFVVFVTQDKASGIDYYEVKESRQKILTLFSRWRAAESPYILADQELRSFIFVKAIDKAGNERIVKINPKNPLEWYENYENWIIIVLGLVIVFAIKKFLWRKLNTKKHE
jgi:GxxExxY protein